MSSRRIAAFASLVAASGLCVALVAARIAYSGSSMYLFLTWNLFLAWIPFLAALAVYDLHRRGTAPRRLALPSILWLLFLPNAPYMLTDFVHLGPRPGVPLLLDALVIAAFAWAGMLLGFASLYLMQSVARRLYGVRASWLFAVAALSLSSFGIYLGRFRNWNSWDLFVNPGRLVLDVGARIADPLAYSRAWALTLALAAFLSVSYLVVYTLAQLPRDER